MTKFGRKSKRLMRMEKILIFISLAFSHFACQCQMGYFGDTCEKNCPEHCDSTGCEQTDGKCTGVCRDGYYGDYCKKSCPDNCIRHYCFQNGTCIACEKRFHGDKCEIPCSNCLTECFKDTGNCSIDGCKMNYYGSKCEKKCNETCVDGEGCDMMSGRCGKCDDTKYGDFCEFNCNTNCIDGRCERNGTCKQGCENKSFYGSRCDQACNNSITNCVHCEDENGSLHCTRCTSARYGSKCEQECPKNCENCISETECTHCLENILLVTEIVNVAGLDVGAVVAIVVGVLILIIFGIIIYFLIYKRKQSQKSENHKTNGTKHARPEITDTSNDFLSRSKSEP